MLFLQNIEIKQFKGLDSVTIGGCGRINALVGKNNSGKSSILHAVDMAGLALQVNAWNYFQPKLEIKDLFSDAGSFSIGLIYQDGSQVSITTNPPHFNPLKNPNPNEKQKFKSILIWPDVSAGMKQRQHHTPQWIIQQVEQRNFAMVDSLEMLFAN